jgi:Tfp pilus assembly protein FimT
MKKKAFSLIETVIIVSIIAILFFITLPKLSFMNRFVLQNETGKLFSVFSFLQQRAIASNQEQMLCFDIENNSYSYQGKAGGDVVCALPKPVIFGFLQNAMGSPSKSSKKINTSITFKKDKNGKRVVRFFADGTMSSGTVYLIDKDKTYMCAVTIPVSQVSFVRMYRYDRDYWIRVQNSPKR